MSSGRAARALAFLAVAIVLGVLVGIMQPDVATIVLIAVAPVALLLGLRYPEYALVAYLFAGSFKAVIPIPIDLTVLLALVVIVVALVRISRQGMPTIEWPMWTFLALTVLVVGGVVYGGMTSYGVIKASRFATLGLVAFLGTVASVRDEESVVRFADATLLIGSLMSAYAALSGGNPLEYGRFTAFGSNTIALGRAAALSLAAGAVRSIWRPKILPVMAPVMLLSIWALVGSGSRGPAVATVLALAVLVIVRTTQKGTSRWVPVVVGLASAGGAAYLWQSAPQAAITRFTGVASGVLGTSIETRLQLIATAAQVIRDHPLAGVGTGAFSRYTNLAVYPHNMLLELWSENGILAVVMILIVLVTALVRGGRCMRRHPGIASDFLMIALITSITNAMVSGDLNDNRVLYAIVAMVLAQRQWWSSRSESGTTEDDTERIDESRANAPTDGSQSGAGDR